MLRTLEDCLRLRADLVAGARLVVIGAGFIGAEVASTARSLGGLQVTVVDPVPVPMSRVLTEEIGGWFVDLHRDHGVHTRFGVGVENIEGGERGNLKIGLTDGTVLEADTVVVGIGAVPNDGWLMRRDWSSMTAWSATSSAAPSRHKTSTQSATCRVGFIAPAA